VPEIRSARHAGQNNAFLAEIPHLYCKVCNWLESSSSSFGAESRAASAPIVAFAAPKRYK
jgi:hypothetical protein